MKKDKFRELHTFKKVLEDAKEMRKALKEEAEEKPQAEEKETKKKNGRKFSI